MTFGQFQYVLIIFFCITSFNYKQHRLYIRKGDSIKVNFKHIITDENEENDSKKDQRFM